MYGSIRHRTALIGIAVLLAALAGNGSAGPTADTIFDAPARLVGKRIEDWARFLGPHYELRAVRSYRNPHTDNPWVVVTLQDQSTIASFAVDLITDEQYLTGVESSSLDFLAALGVDVRQLSAAGEHTTWDCHDGGCNSLTFKRNRAGESVAVWQYHWD